MSNTTHFSDKEITRLLELCEKATPGPWTPAEKHGMDTIWLDIESDAGDELFNLEPRYIGHVGDQNHKQGQIDMRFIAAARSALPAALNELKSLRGEAKRVVELLKRREEEKRYLDGIAKVLYPHKLEPDERWTYLPDQLAEMVTALLQERDQLRVQNAELLQTGEKLEKAADTAVDALARLHPSLWCDECKSYANECGCSTTVTERIAGRAIKALAAAKRDAAAAQSSASTKTETGFCDLTVSSTYTITICAKCGKPKESAYIIHSTETCTCAQPSGPPKEESK